MVLSSWKYDPSCSSYIWILTFYPYRIPGSKRHLDPGSGTLVISPPLFFSRDSYKPFRVDGIQIGLIVPDVREELANYPNVFMITDTEVTFNNKLRTFLDRSEALKSVLLELRSKDRFVSLRGWRNECYEICETFGSMPLFEIERAAAPILGLRKYGVHINGYVNHSVQGLCMWIQRRSPTKQTYPGKLGM
jgi:hypothetical protein